MTDQELTTRITKTLEAAGIYIDAERDNGTITLAGAVDSDENRQAALDVANAVAGPVGLTVNDQLEVMTVIPDDAFDERDQGASEFELADSLAPSDVDDDSEPGLELEPDFTGDIGTTNARLVVEEGDTYFPPTDPVVRPVDDGEEQLEIVGGFEATAMDDEMSSPGIVRARNDDELADAVHRELISDASTTDLGVRVAAVEGTVILTGSVPSLDDAENAEAVASRVPGVVEVREELTIEPAVE
jgi:osmotically-inducible protein OsmY